MRYIFGFLFGITLTVAVFLGYFYVQHSGTVPATPTVTQGGQNFSVNVRPALVPSPTPDTYAPPAGNWSPAEVTYLHARMPEMIDGMTAYVNLSKLATQASQNLDLVLDPTWTQNMTIATNQMIHSGQMLQTPTTVPPTMTSIEAHVQRIAALLIDEGGNMQTGSYQLAHGTSSDIVLTNGASDSAQITAEFKQMSAEMTVLEQRP